MDKSDVDKGTSDGTDGVKVKDIGHCGKTLHCRVLIKSYSNYA